MTVELLDEGHTVFPAFTRRFWQSVRSHPGYLRVRENLFPTFFTGQSFANLRNGFQEVLRIEQTAAAVSLKAEELGGEAPSAQQLVDVATEAYSAHASQPDANQLWQLIGGEGTQAFLDVQNSEWQELSSHWAQFAAMREEATWTTSTLYESALAISQADIQDRQDDSVADDSAQKAQIDAALKQLDDVHDRLATAASLVIDAGGNLIEGWSETERGAPLTEHTVRQDRRDIPEGDEDPRGSAGWGAAAAAAVGGGLFWVLFNELTADTPIEENAGDSQGSDDQSMVYLNAHAGPMGGSTFVPEGVTIHFYGPEGRSLEKLISIHVLSSDTPRPVESLGAGQSIKNYSLLPLSSEDTALALTFIKDDRKIYLIPHETRLCTSPKRCLQHGKGQHICDGELANLPQQGHYEIHFLACRGWGPPETDNYSVEQENFVRRTMTTSAIHEALNTVDRLVGTEFSQRHFESLSENERATLMATPRFPQWNAVHQARGFLANEGALQLYTYFVNAPSQEQKWIYSDTDLEHAISWAREEMSSTYRRLGAERGYDEQRAWWMDLSPKVRRDLLRAGLTLEPPPAETNPTEDS